MAAGTNHGKFLELQSNPLAKTHPLLAALVDHLLEPAWFDVYPSTGVDSPSVLSAELQLHSEASEGGRS